MKDSTTMASATAAGRHDENAPLRVEQLPSWSTLTSRLLCEDGACAWNVLDEPLGRDFGRRLRAELSCYWQKLRPARTTPQVRMESVLDILSAQGWASYSESRRTTTPARDNNATRRVTESTVRGDQSVFLPFATSREFRPRYPAVSRLVEALTARLSADDFTATMTLDLSRTSIQLAEYPGDGVAAYPRHVDHVPNANRGDSQRLVTALYYLTPEDWHATRDGGALRVFGSNDNNNNDVGDPQQPYTDILPYANRLVIFRSDRVAHAVRPSRRRPRRALTIWWYGRLLLETPVATTESVDSLPVTVPSPMPLMMAQPFPRVVPEQHTTNGPNTNIQQPTIFVSMAAYRDSETGPTLVHMRQTAAYPARLYVGLVLQVDESTTDRATVLDTLPTRDPWYRSNVRTVVVPAHQATGPCCARAMAQLLYRNEDYCLQIDAHMRFRPNFDVYLRQELQSCPHPARSILTTYPVGYQLPNQIPCEIRGTCLYPFAFDTTGMLRQKGRLMETRPVSPVQHSLFAAGLCFGPSAWIRDCPYDGSLHHLFFGEEVSMAIRLYTAGYDLYAPRDTVVYHLWSRAHRPAPAPRISEGLRTASLEKVQSQMRGEGLGKCVRTVQAWAEQVGVNLETNEVLKEMANEWESLNVDD